MIMLIGWILGWLVVVWLHVAVCHNAGKRVCIVRLLFAAVALLAIWPFTRRELAFDIGRS